MNAILQSNPKGYMIWPSVTKFGMVQQGAFFGVSHARYSKGRGQNVPEIFGNSYLHAHGRRKNSQVLHGDQTIVYNNNNNNIYYDQTGWGDNIYTVDHAPPTRDKFFLSRMLTRDMFVVANFRV